MSKRLVQTQPKTSEENETHHRRQQNQKIKNEP
jgi:hypothetical protein